MRNSNNRRGQNKRWWQSLTLATLIIAPIAAICVASYDGNVVHWVAQRDLPGDIEKALQLSEAFAHGSGVIAIFAALLLIDHTKRRRIVSMIGMVVIAMVLANWAKTLVSRSRPYNFEELAQMADTWFPEPTREGWETGIRSFPSGHSATAAAMAFALSNLYPRGKYLFVVLALLACLQRIASRSHYPTDVLAGVTIAAAVSLIWQRFVPQSQSIAVEDVSSDQSENRQQNAA